jgi:hypothetical protein
MFDGFVLYYTTTAFWRQHLPPTKLGAARWRVAGAPKTKLLANQEFALWGFSETCATALHTMEADNWKAVIFGQRHYGSLLCPIAGIFEVRVPSGLGDNERDSKGISHRNGRSRLLQTLARELHFFSASAAAWPESCSLPKNVLGIPTLPSDREHER